MESTSESPQPEIKIVFPTISAFIDNRADSCLMIHNNYGILELNPRTADGSVLQYDKCQQLACLER